MEYLAELFGESSKETLTFFFGHLKKEVASRNVAWEEVLYVANVLSRYAETSHCDVNSFDASRRLPAECLHGILDNSILPGLKVNGLSELKDPDVLETVGSHTLLMVGFFRDHMLRVNDWKHNLAWYDELGSALYARASSRVGDAKKADLFFQIGLHFPFWAKSCQNISQKIYDEPRLIKLN